MKTDLDTAIDLLHTAPSGTLATHSKHLPGYPFATALPFAPDEQHRPLFLVSSLAEHTKNLLADPRASFLVSGSEQANVLAGARMTLVGDAERIETSSELAARYLRYRPEAAQYLALGDFAFFRLAVRKVRYIAGFARMGWIGEADWCENEAVLSLLDEAALISELIEMTPAALRLLGLDCHGIDIERDGRRERLRFPGICAAVGQVRECARRLLAAMQEE